ncbi:MAG: hypothetical protein PW843_20495 [Azospirillaceae bacterium]|nr:hypothetical protein [Azospirillaceae bacterium]
MREGVQIVGEAMTGPAVGPGVVASSMANALGVDAPAFGPLGLAAVLGGAELAVYAVLVQTLPLLDLGVDATLLAWGVGLTLMGPLMGLAALYAILQVRLRKAGDRMAPPNVAQAPPRGPLPAATRAIPRPVEASARSTTFPVETAHPFSHPG